LVRRRLRRNTEQDYVFLEPVEAYDRIAAVFSRLSDLRRAYCNRIDQLVIAEIPQGKHSLLDIGAGDGSRARRIAGAASLPEFVLLEPSAAMRSQWPAETRGWAIRAEELGGKNGQFDVIICLWNVLGHIFPASSRVEVLRQCARLLSPGGLLFIDVSHRYNALHYGVLPTLLRMLRDRILPNENNGDVAACWNVNGHNYATTGHVFTDAEFRRIASLAGLTIRTTLAVDYTTGEIRRSKFAGHLLYELAR
jgi:2-polyprenyl-3-methyl-5-hydroxy-6-metoxy-1,4-benzoquinol methylase